MALASGYSMMKTKKAKATNGGLARDTNLPGVPHDLTLTKKCTFYFEEWHSEAPLTPRTLRGREPQGSIPHSGVDNIIRFIKKQADLIEAAVTCGVSQNKVMQMIREVNAALTDFGG